MRRNILPSILLAMTVGLAAGPASAVDIRSGGMTVVELFTSQGCSRCPDADALLAELGGREDVLALGYHIDYWDYIGWEDTFALPQNTELQKAYAQSWGKNRIYTPQMVVNGAEAVVGSDEEGALSAIATASMPIEVDLAREGEDAVKLTASGAPGTMPSVVWLVTYRDAADVEIERGENSGRVLSYTHIVTGRQPIGMWDPDAGAEISVPFEEVLANHADGAAVIIQEKKGDLPGRIIGAAGFHR